MENIKSQNTQDEISNLAKELAKLLREGVNSYIKNEIKLQLNEDLTKALSSDKKEKVIKALEEAKTVYIEEGVFSKALVALLLIPDEEEKNKALKEFVDECIQRGKKDEQHFLDWCGKAAIVAHYLASDEEREKAIIKIGMARDFMLHKWIGKVVDEETKEFENFKRE